MPFKPTDLSALLGSRICHDLISPIGAISNGVELLQLSGDESPELTLINEAVTNANQRIRYFRVAFGAASEGQMIGHNEIEKTLGPEAFGQKLMVNWHPAEDHKKREVKLAFLSLLCLETCMPYGGTMNVTHSGDRWCISGRAERLKAVPELWKEVHQDTETALPAPAHLQFALLGAELKNQGRSVKVEIAETEITLTF